MSEFTEIRPTKTFSKKSKIFWNCPCHGNCYEEYKGCDNPVCKICYLEYMEETTISKNKRLGSVDHPPNYFSNWIWVHDTQFSSDTWQTVFHGIIGRNPTDCKGRCSSSVNINIPALFILERNYNGHYSDMVRSNDR